MKTRIEEVLEVLEDHAGVLAATDVALTLNRPGHKVVSFAKGLSRASENKITAQDLLDLVTHHREMQSFIKCLNESYYDEHDCEEDP